MNNAMNAKTCDAKMLSDFLQDRLSACDEADLAKHLDQCSACRKSLSAAAASNEIWASAENFLKNDAKDSELRDQFGSILNRDRSERNTHQIKQVLDVLAPTDDPQSLGRLGAYEVTGVVGSGGMGVVLKAIEKSLERTVAIKVLAPHLGANAAARRRFARESKATAAVLHPNVVAIHSVSNDAALPYLVMPYIAGQSLQDRLDTTGSLELIEILRISQQIASGLAASHAQGLVHRDIKPANVLLHDGVERVTITDFGLARAVDDASMTRTGVIAGTPQFMSPEQARGDSVDGRSDLFSLGSVMYAMCTGHPPFRAETSYGVLRRITDDAPRNIRELNPVIPVWFVSLVNLLLEKTPERRFESANKLEVVLKQCIAHVEQPTKQPLPNEVLSTRSTRRLPWIVATLLLLITVPLYQVSVLPPKALTPIAQTPVVEPPNTEASKNAVPLETPVVPESSLTELVEELEETLDTKNVDLQQNILAIPFPFDEHLSNSKDQIEYWELTLEECISLALQNAKFVRSSDDTTSEDSQAILADFEIRVRNLVRDVEVAYWNLFVSYHLVSRAIEERNHVIKVAQCARLNLDNGTGTVQEIAQAVEQFDQFRGLVESGLAGSNSPGADRFGIYGRERALRVLLGLAASDGRLIHPVDIPVKEELKRSLTTSITEAIRRNPEIRKQNFRLNQLELELATTKKLVEPKNPLLPLHDREDLLKLSDVEPPQRIGIFPSTLEARQEAARLRRCVLRFEREKAKLEDSSRVLIKLLSDAFEKTSAHFQLMHTSLQQWEAAETEVEARTAEFKIGRTPVNVVLQSSQQRADASVDYYRALAEYGKSLSYIDYLSGTLLASKNINLNEVTWRNSSSN